MAQKNSEPVKTEVVSYDERKKLLTHTTRETKETEMGTLVMETKGILKVEGIKKTLKGLKEKKEALEKSFEILEELQAPTPDMTKEQMQLKEDLKVLQKINHDENITEEKKKEEVDNLKNTKEELSKTKGMIKDITEAIGSRLKI